MIQSRLAKLMVVYFIIISSTSFYTFNKLPESFREMVLIAAVGLMAGILVLGLLPDPSPRLKKYFRLEVYLFLTATFLSMFVAKIYHYQDFGITFIVQRFMYFYLFYFVLHQLKPDVEDIESIILPLGILYASLYIFQYLAYPQRFFNSRIDAERGTVRIFLPGAGFLMLAYFKSLQKFFFTNKVKYIIIALYIFSVGGVLSGTRQALASLVLISLIFVFFNRKVKSRLFIISMAGLAGAAIFVIFYEIFMEMITITQQQTTQQKPNIRVSAARYFLTEFMPAKIAYFTGNGQDSLNSNFGQRVNILKLVRGFYQSDVGIIGDYSKFGILFVIAQLSIMARIIFGRIPHQIAYIRYYYISTALVMFSGGNIFGTADGIAFVCVTLYVVDCYKNLQAGTYFNSESRVNKAHSPPE